MDSYELLRVAGWYPGRQVDTASGEQALIAAGYRLHDAALAVLAEFSGLTISGPEYVIEGRNGPRNRRRQLWIDGVRAAAECESPGACIDYSEAVGDTLVPVGCELQTTFMIGETGAVWGAFTDSYAFTAHSCIEAVAVILVPSDEKWPPPLMLPFDSAEMLQQRKLQEDRRNQQRDWRRFRRRSR